MSFVHPGIAIATLGLALLPILIHLINRRRYRREPWAAMQFLLKAHQRSRRRIQFDQWWLLVLRTLVILLIGLALARPYASRLSTSRFLTAPQYDRIVIIDDGLSMQARLADGRRAFEAAKETAIQIIDKAQAGDGVGLITASSPPRRWMDQPAHHLDPVRNLVESLRCSFRKSDLLTAIDEASQMLAQGAAVEGCREVYVLTDLSRSSFNPSGTDMSQFNRTSNVDRLFFVDVGPENRMNLSISNLRCEGQIVGAGMPVRLTWDVINHGPEIVEGASVELRLDGRLVRTIELEKMLPDSTIPSTADMAFPTAGLHKITASLVLSRSDVLEIDNTCHLAVRVAEQVPVLLVEGESGNEPARQALFYYRVALTTESRDGVNHLIRPRTTTPGELESQILDDYEVIVLGNVRRLPDRTWDRLTRWVRAGGGLMMILGEQVQRDNYLHNNITGENKTVLMPVRIGEFIRIDEDETIRFKISDFNHPVLADFAGHDQGGLQMVRVRQYWGIDKEQAAKSAPKSAPKFQTVLSLTNGEPAVLATHVEKGRVLIWLTGVDMVCGNLPAKPDYLPLMLNMTAYVAESGKERSNLHVGETIVRGVDAVHLAEAATVVSPNGSVETLQPEILDKTPAVSFHDTEQPGFYRINVGDDVELFAVNTQSEAGDLRVVDKAELKNQFGNKSELISREGKSAALAASGPAHEFARVAIFLLIATVLLETMTATSMGPRK